MIAALLLPLLATAAAVSPAFAAPTANVNLLPNAIVETLAKQITRNDTRFAQPHVAREMMAGAPTILVGNDGIIYGIPPGKEDVTYEDFKGRCEPDTKDWKDGYVKVRCLEWQGERIVDIRRFGASPTNCKTTQQTETWKTSESATNTHHTWVEAGVNLGAFSMSAGYSFTNEVTQSQEYQKTVSCNPDFDGFTCELGGLALIEFKMLEFYIKFNPECENCHDIMEITEKSHFKYNAQMPGGWYSWVATDEDCFRWGGRHYATNPVRT